MFSSSFSIEFETVIGKCFLEFDNDINYNSIDYISFIQKDLEKLVNQFGAVDKNSFKIYITNNSEKFRK